MPDIYSSIQQNAFNAESCFEHYVPVWLFIIVNVGSFCSNESMLLYLLSGSSQILRRSTEQNCYYVDFLEMSDSVIVGN